jgi:membrane-bound serine protease (ClpP class)
LLTILVLLAATPAIAQIVPADDYGKVGYAKISGPINRTQYQYLQRTLATAKAEQLDTLIMHIDTDGGEVFYARDMLKQVLDQQRENLRMIAFVDYRAISAGAMIAYGHEAIYIAETASIGDIGVIFFKPSGEMEYAPEKIETVIRTLLAQAAEQRGWSRGLLLKMTARNQNLYRVTLADGEVEYIIEDDLAEFLARHPDIDRDNSQQVIVYRGEDRLLTLTGREAFDLGMATALVADIEALYTKLDIDAARVVDLTPSIAERIAFALGPLASVFAGLALMFLFFEFKTPGIGLWALLGAICGLLFLLSQYYLDMVNYLDLVLIVLGLVLLITEFFTLAGGGLLGLGGAALVLGGLIMAFLPNEFEFDLNDPRYLDALAHAGINGIVAIAVMTVGVLGFIALMPRSRLGRRLAVQSEISSTSAGALESDSGSLIGHRGSALDRLRPSGDVTIDGEQHSARAEHGVFVTPGSAVEVVAVQFGELIVRPLAEPGQDAANE